MKKKVVLALTIAAISATALIGGTLAWFTASDNKVNTITTGTVALNITEKKYDELLEKNPNTNSKNVIPGSVITKDPVIHYTGTADAYMRYKVTATITAADGKTVLPLSTTVGNTEFGLVYKLGEAEVSIKNGEWTNISETTNQNVTVNKVVTAGDTAIFDTVTIPEQFGNEYQGATISIKVEAQAVQVDALKDPSANWDDIIIKSNANVGATATTTQP